MKSKIDIKECKGFGKPIKIDDSSKKLTNWSGEYKWSHCKLWGLENQSRYMKALKHNKMKKIPYTDL